MPGKGTGANPKYNNKSDSSTTSDVKVGNQETFLENMTFTEKMIELGVEPGLLEEKQKLLEEGNKTRYAPRNFKNAVDVNMNPEKYMTDKELERFHALERSLEMRRTLNGGLYNRNAMRFAPNVGWVETKEPKYAFIKSEKTGQLVKTAFMDQNALDMFNINQEAEGYTPYADRIAAPEAPTHVPAKKAVVMGDWSENVLNEMDSSTYHLTLWIDNVQRVNHEIHQNQGVVIAETGASTYFTIDNLEIVTAAGGSDIITNDASQLTFTLTEPNGAAFFPKLLEIARQKGIKSISEAGYALEIRFKGRDKITGKPASDSHKWLYKLVVTDIQTKHDVQGSVYNFTAHNMDQRGSFEYWNNPKQTISLTETTTLGDAIKDLENKLNDYHAMKAVANGGKPDTVKITLMDPKWKSWKLLTPKGSTNTTWKEGARDWSMDRGSSVKDFIGKLLIHTNEMIDRLDKAGADIKPDSREDVAHCTDYLCNFFKIKTTIEYGNLWNEVAKKYNERIEYVIMPYLEHPPEKQARYEQIRRSKTKQKQKIADHIRHNFLKKRYDYLNTGMNTEVLEFNANIDMAFFQPELIYDGRTTYGAKAKEHNVPEDPSDVDTSTVSYNKEKADLSTIEGVQSEIDRLNTDFIETGKERADAESKVKNASGPAEFSSLTDAITKSKNKMNKIQADLTMLDKVKGTMLRWDEGIAGASDSFDRQYLGDIGTYEDYSLVRKYKPTVISRAGQDPESSMIELAQQRIKNISSELLSIEVGIKGDPYWLGPPTNEKSVLQKQVRPANRSTFKVVDTNLFVDYDHGPPLFLFSMFFPDHGGKPYFNKLYSGVYQTIDIIHQFRNGQFTQFLKGTRMTDIQEEQVKMLVDAKDPTVLNPYGDDITDDYFDEGLNNVGTDGAPIGPAEPGPASVSAREQQVMSRLINEHGLTPEQAAGIVGNLNKESALKTGARNVGDGNDGSDSIGIAQWNSTRAQNLQNWAAANGRNHLDLDTQTDFIMHELNGSGSYGGGSESLAWNKLNDPNISTQGAAEAFTYYERFKNYNVANNPETISRKSQSERILLEYNQAKTSGTNTANSLGLGT
tara:strand:+ start:2595 stop:5837 length:3243 start_codon:yes stop_codon:yes gene_type:complete